MSWECSGPRGPDHPSDVLTRASRTAAVRESKVTIKIPRPLYRKIQQVVEDSGIDSPTYFIVYVLRDLMGEAEAQAQAINSRLLYTSDAADE